MAVTPGLQLPALTQGQAGAEVRVNQAFWMLEALIKGVESQTATPPGSPNNGQAHIVAADATGAWTSQVDSVAIWVGSEWAFIPPKIGMRLYENTAQRFLTYDGNNWSHDSDSVLIVCHAINANVGITSLNFDIQGSGDRPTTSYGLPIAFGGRIVQVAINAAHLNGSDPGDWTFVVEPFGGGTDIVHIAVPFASTSLPTLLTTTFEITGGDFDAGANLQITASGPSTTAPIMFATLVLERILPG